VALLDKEQVALQQSFDAFREMRVARREPFFLERFAELQDRIFRNARAYEFSRRLPPIFGEVVIIICIALAVVILVRRAPEPGEVTIGLGLLAAVAFRLSPLANRIVGAVGTIENTSSGLSILAAELATASSQTRQSSAYGPPVAFRNSIELKGVSLAFFGRDRPALRTVDLTLRPGEAIGIVGPSGSGKTTLADILLGLLQPTEGTMTIDGEPAEKGRHVNAGYVPQDILLFDDTLRANVAFGVPPSTVSDDHVHHLLKVVQLTDLVEQLPDGLDARLGERGRLISGGQRQRIGIARALYHAPDLLVLDEATSALDAQTEERIAEAIAALRGTVTIVAIAHRLSTVRNCDSIVLLDDGEIIDQGGFDDLNARNAAFRSMVRLTIPGAEGEQRREGSRPRLPAKSS
jgi:ATP-binding cassette subfamily C protein